MTKLNIGKFFIIFIIMLLGGAMFCAVGFCSFVVPYAFFAALLIYAGTLRTSIFAGSVSALFLELMTGWSTGTLVIPFLLAVMLLLFLEKRIRFVPLAFSNNKSPGYLVGLVLFSLVPYTCMLVGFFAIERFIYGETIEYSYTWIVHQLSYIPEFLLFTSVSLLLLSLAGSSHRSRI